MDGMNRHLLYKSTPVGHEEIAQLIIQQCAKSFNTTLDAVLSNSRNRNKSVLPRQCAIFLIKRKFPKTSLQKVGQFFVGHHRDTMDHSTCIHACRKVKQYISDETWGDKDFKDKFNHVVKSLWDNYGVNV